VIHSIDVNVNLYEEVLCQSE